MAGVARSIELQNFMAAKLKVNFFVLYYRSPYRLKKQRKFCWYIKFSHWKGGCLIQEVIRARLDTARLRLSSTDEVVSRRCKLRNRKTGEQN